MARMNPIVAVLPLLMALLVSSCASRPVAPQPGETAMVDWTSPSANLCVKLAFEDGEEVLCEIDTGGPMMALDRSLEPRLGQKTGTGTMTWAFREPHEVRVFPAPKLFLNGTRIWSSPEAFTEELTTLHGDDYEARCVVGMDTLRHYCMQLDFAEKKVRMLDPEQLDVARLGRSLALDLRSPRSFFGAFPWNRAKGAITFADAGFFPGEEERFLIDTGFTGGNMEVMLTSKLFRRTISLQRPDWILTPTNSPLYSRVAGFSQLPFMGHIHRDVVVGELREPQGAFEGWIGARFLSRYLVTLNFPKKMLYLKPRTDMADWPTSG